MRYDAVEKTLYLSTQNAQEFTLFLCTATGYGTVTLRNGAAEVQVVKGQIPVEHIVIS